MQVETELEELYVTEEEWLKKNGYKIVNRASKLHEKFLIAEKNTENGKIEIYGSFLPAHFFEIVVSTPEKKVVFSTGSGSLDEYMEKLIPVISGFLDDIIDIEVMDNGGEGLL
jgi:hypothetical protein